MSRELETTKRNTLKISALIYDPLIVSPVTARLKTIFVLRLDRVGCDFEWRE